MIKTDEKCIIFRAIKITRLTSYTGPTNQLALTMDVLITCRRRRDCRGRPHH